MQVPCPLTHGDEAQKLTVISQREPEKPGTQTHVAFIPF